MTSLSADLAAGASARRATNPSSWILGPRRDVLLAFTWVPFAVMALAVMDDPDRLRTLMIATFAVSAAHQPLTLPLVYMDGAQRNQRPWLYRLTPLVMVALIVVAVEISFTLVALVAGTWNALHTLQQRYGLTRIYGRKAARPDGAGDRALLWSWFLTVIVISASSSSLAHDIDRVDLGARNRRALEVLVDIRPLAQAILPLALIITAAITIRWLREEVRGGSTPGRIIYLAATAALLATMAVSPVVGFIAYVGSHAVEYFVIVNHRLARTGPDDPSALASAVRSPVGPIGAIVVFTAAVIGAMAFLEGQNDRLYTTAFLTLGALHIFYDGFIWKLRTPAMGDRFALRTQTEDPPPIPSR